MALKEIIKTVDRVVEKPITTVVEVEKIIANLFSDFDVCRLPEAFLGACVSPLTANAPTHDDSFSYHIDADPNQAPPCKYICL